MPRLPLLAALLLSVSLTLGAGGPDAAIAEGDRAREDGRPAEAVEAYSRALEEDPCAVPALHGRALARRRLGEFRAALADLAAAVELEPRNAALHHDLGLTRLDAGNLKGAVEAYDEAIRLDPGVSRTWNNRGFARRLLGDADGALRDITMAIQIDPGSARAYRHRALCLYNLGDWEDALGDFETAVRLEPAGQDHAHLRLWILRARLGRRAKADGALEAWLDAGNPADGFPQAAGRFLLGKATRQELLDAAGTGGGRDERVRRSEAHFLAASRALADGDPDAARADLEAALRQGVEGTEVIRSATAELERLGRKE